MNTFDLHPASIALPRDRIHRLTDGRGRRIEALSGSLWITMDGVRRDVLVEAGGGFSIDADGPTLISALTDARFLVLDGAAGGPVAGPTAPCP